MTGSRVAPAWFSPTRRAIDWTPLIVIAVAQLITATVLGWRTGEVPDLVQHLGVAGLAAAVALGLDDPARPLLQVLPTPAIERLAHRVVLLVGATAVITAVLVATANLVVLSSVAEPELAAALMALIAAGIAVQVAASPLVDHASEAAAGAVLMWVGAAATIPPEIIPDAVRLAWLDHPWPVSAAAVAVTLVVTAHPSA